MRFVVTGGEGVKIRSFLDQLRNQMEDLGLYQYEDVRIRIGEGGLSYYLEEVFFFEKFIKGGSLTMALNLFGPHRPVAKMEPLPARSRAAARRARGHAGDDGAPNLNPAKNPSRNEVRWRWLLACKARA